jgi:GNAT superfamily N-acetyltransferase
MTPAVLAEVMEATWPPAKAWRVGPFTCRDGDGGGKRVSAASCEADFDGDELDAAIAAMAEPLFLIREGESALDAALDARGWRIVDPVVAYAAPVARLTGELPHLAAFPHWPPLEVAASIWAEGGEVGMLHALEVRPALRRTGVGRTLLHAAANWAAAMGASHLSLVVTRQNTAARALYARLGMETVGQYHYRMK